MCRHRKFRPNLTRVPKRRASTPTTTATLLSAPPGCRPCLPPQKATIQLVHDARLPEQRAEKLPLLPSHHLPQPHLRLRPRPLASEERESRPRRPLSTIPEESPCTPRRLPSQSVTTGGVNRRRKQGCSSKTARAGVETDVVAAKAAPDSGNPPHPPSFRKLLELPPRHLRRKQRRTRRLRRRQRQPVAIEQEASFRARRRPLPQWEERRHQARNRRRWVGKLCPMPP